jgi:hypothetical protein
MLNEALQDAYGFNLVNPGNDSAADGTADGTDVVRSHSTNLQSVLLRRKSRGLLRRPSANKVSKGGESVGCDSGPLGRMRRMNLEEQQREEYTLGAQYSLYSLLLYSSSSGRSTR